MLIRSHMVEMSKEMLLGPGGEKLVKETHVAAGALLGLSNVGPFSLMLRNRKTPLFQRVTDL